MGDRWKKGFPTDEERGFAGRRECLIPDRVLGSPKCSPPERGEKHKENLLFEMDGERTTRPD